MSEKPIVTSSNEPMGTDIHGDVRLRSAAIPPQPEGAGSPGRFLMDDTKVVVNDDDIPAIHGGAGAKTQTVSLFEPF
jgi:hypothetical protein